MFDDIDFSPRIIAYTSNNLHNLVPECSKYVREIIG